MLPKHSCCSLPLKTLLLFFLHMWIRKEAFYQLSSIKTEIKKETIAPITHQLFHDITGVTVVMGCKGSRIRALLVQHSNGISGFDLIKTKGEGEATGQLFDSTECGGWAVEPVAQLRQHFIEQLSKKRYKKCCCCIIFFFKKKSFGSKSNKISFLKYPPSEWESVDTDLLKTNNECLCTLDLVNLPSFAHSLLDYVTIIIVILQGGETREKEVRTFFPLEFHRCICCINSPVWKF